MIADVELPVSATPPAVQGHPGHAEVAQLADLLQPPLHALLTEVILTLVAGVPVRPCVGHICT